MDTVTMTAPTPAVAATKSRRVAGLVLPFGVPGNSSAGRVTARAGAVSLPTDLSRVKLLRDHSDNPGGFQPVGYAVSAEEREDGLHMEFAVSASPDGDAAIADVADRVRDGMSVELVATDISSGELRAGQLTAVALVPIPAFADARVTDFTASRKEPPMSDSPAGETTTAAAPNLTEAANKLKGAAGTVTSVADSLGTGAVPSPGPKPPATAADPEPAMTAAHVPAGMGVPSRVTVTEKAVTFAQIVETLTMRHNGEAIPDSLTAALTDITRSANPAISAPAWLGELWSGNTYQREIVPTFTKGKLTRLKAVGYRFTKKPEMKDYAGNKAEIPSGPVTTEAVEVAAKRLATGNDIDRAYWDFGETEFINAYMRAGSESYALVTDAKAAAFAVESGAGNVAAAQPSLLHAAAKARQSIKLATRTEATTFLVHPDDMFKLFEITQLDNPAYLDLLGVKPERFLSTPLATKGTLTAYAKPAMTFYELGETPIRANAEDIARGGRDTALFGYWATLLNDQRGVVNVPFGTVTEPGE